MKFSYKALGVAASLSVTAAIAPRVADAQPVEGGSTRGEGSPPRAMDNSNVKTAADLTSDEVAQLEIAGIRQALGLEISPALVDSWLVLSDTELQVEIAKAGVEIPVERITKHRGTLVVLDEVRLALAPPFDDGTITENLAEWSRWRGAQGFSTDQDAVVKAAQSATGQRTAADWGAPFTAGEEQELIIRDTLRQQRGPALDAASAIDGYGGFWSDPTNGDGFLAFTSEAPRDAVSAAVALLPVDHLDRFHLTSVRFSYASLDAAKEKLIDQYDSGVLKIELVSVGIDEMQNALRVVVREGALKELALSLSSSLGVTVNVEQGTDLTPEACTTRWACASPLRGGTAIDEPGCSSAFVATDSVGNDFMLTAGHCFQAGADTTDLHIGGYAHQFQDAVGNKFVNNSETDSIRIGIEDAQKSNTIYLDGGNSAYAITAVQNEGASNDHVGDPVCKTGQTTGNTCGHITDANEDFQAILNGGLIWIKDHNVADYSSGPGDSGAAVYYDHEAFGIHAGANSLGRAYTHIEEAEIAHGLVVRTSK